MQSELWSEKRWLNQFEVIGGLLRDEFKKEQTMRINLSYLANAVDHWWEDKPVNKTNEFLILSLEKVILTHLKEEHRNALQNIGTQKFRIAAIFLEYAFSFPDKELARLTHEVFSKIAGIVDIKYPYEEHKELFPKNADQLASDWGKGLGIIRPHSDDLYEDRDINIMSLTVCKDTSRTPTWFWLQKDIVSVLADEELGMLALAEATFFSGTNVEGTSSHHALRRRIVASSHSQQRYKVGLYEK